MKDNTPTPWRRGKGGDAQYIQSVGDGSQPVKLVAELYYGGLTPEERHANADLIVRAVNSHEALVEACRLGDNLGNDGPLLLRYAADLVEPFAPHTARKLLRKADAEEAALAKARA